ncbi:PA2778 family cysteine peptidase [Candidatus Nitrotoga fabula]|uniref:Peptidase_C39_2 domain-containing protein n=1 Tax=Candidatus Nitrotoga fabula TaxID=2182327 RepID=A0A916BF09_9PROT|nr:PA2778 family cysteine peptidase [Candidatus Nitrotoga fabula]CAE6739415.1 Peptidase_C39_2 domain-containing protein [Candidatus Nitrotoga fabula]
MALRRVICLLLVIFLLGGCATSASRLQAQIAADLPLRRELSTTPFFPDDSYFCGPSALATVLSAAGLATQPEALIGQVFLPGREGSLQIEMLAGARRQGAVAMVIPGTLEALLREIAAGHPVVVLQNLGLSWAPSWHYAVVIGYDAGQILLRSGTLARQEMSLRTFENTWNRSQRWAFVALLPGRLPVTADETEATRALVAFERSAPAATAVQAYRSGLERWPGNFTLAMGLGNALYASGDRAGAEVVFRRAAESHDLAAAHNNHARVLLELGRIGEARRAAERGLAVAGAQRQTLLETLKAIETAEEVQ